MKLEEVSKGCIFGFQRLRINDVSEAGDQPIRRGKLSVICNGEIYNYHDLQAKYNFPLKSGSDCEIILHLYEKYGCVEDFIDELDGIFAFVLNDEQLGVTFLGRDAIGVRPIFWGTDKQGNTAFASEAKVLLDVIDPDTIVQFPPGHHWRSDTRQFTKWWDPVHNLEEVDLDRFDEGPALKKTAELLYASVKKRMLSDRPIGTLLSGGLDSSLVAAFIMKHLRESGVKPKLNSFSVGMEGSPDLAYANLVANHIGSNHHHVQIDNKDCLNAMHDTIYATETFDSETIRDSTPMYILSRYIRDNTDDVVIYSGDGSDEVSQGYLYFKKQPTPQDGALESKRMMEHLHMFDVLRVDRTTASHGLETREPFLDKDWMRHYFSLPANIKCPRNNREKYHLRKAIAVTFPDLLPEEILWRQKEAFGDGVTNYEKKSWFDEVKDHANATITDEEFATEQKLLTPMPL
jgi:asparagine synthase (glutamine-hydrolysing)